MIYHCHADNIIGFVFIYFFRGFFRVVMSSLWKRISSQQEKFEKSVTGRRDLEGKLMRL